MRSRKCLKLKFVLKHYLSHEYTDPFFSKVKITASFLLALKIQQSQSNYYITHFFKLHN